EGRSSPAIRDHRVFGAAGNAVRLVATDMIRRKPKKTWGSAPVNCYPDSSLQYGLQAFRSSILSRAIGNEEDIFGLQPDIFVTAIQNFFDRDRNGLASALDLANDLGPIQGGHRTISAGER